MAGAPTLCSSDEVFMRDPHSEVMLSGRTSHTRVESLSFFVSDWICLVGGDLSYVMLCITLVLWGWSVINPGVSSGGTSNFTILPKDTELALGMTLLELHWILQVFCVRQEDGGGVNRGS